MGDIWLIADLHLGHLKLINGWDYDGITPSGPRKQFKSLMHMRDEIFTNWEKVVKPQDKIYVLGDIAWNSDHLQEIAMLPGKKRAVLGNHDDGHAPAYEGVFDALYGAKTLPGGILLTHIPVHESQLTRGSMQHNIHGHLHDEVMEQLHHDQWIDHQIYYEGTSIERTVGRFMTQTVKVMHPKYTCVSCEQVNYTPINLEEIKAKLK